LYNSRIIPQPPSQRPRLLWFLGVTTLLLVTLGVARALDPLQEGLIGTYYEGSGWTSAPVRSAIDAPPSTDSFFEAWKGNPPRQFSATWVGSLSTLRSGTYTFATSSDDGSWVYIDGAVVVDNGGLHGLRQVSGTTHLERGVHSILVKYFQDQGDFSFELLWAREAQALSPIPGWAFSSRHADRSRTFASVFMRLGLQGAFWIWLGSLLVVGITLLLPRTREPSRRLMADWTGRALVAVVAGSFALNVAGIWWGLPALWAGDEFTPTSVLLALSERFTNGWFNRYPPFHFYVLSVVFSPWLLLKHLGWIHVSYQLEDFVFPLVSRLVSTAAGVGTVVAVYACGARAFSRRAGVFAAAMIALLAPFLYYAKTANPEVPYVFWFALSLVFYLRLLDTGALRDGIAFAIAAVLATCTKDQAYALYLSTPAVIVYHFWRMNREAGLAHPLRRAILNSRLALIGLSGAAAFIAIYNMPFNLAGFVSHVKDITGVGSQPYQMVPATLSGRLSLLQLSAELNERSWGWPLSIVSLIGLFVAARDRRTWRVSVALALVAIGYYVGFIDTILYVYDRYLLPVCVVEALFGGLALDRFLRTRAGAVPVWRSASVAAILAYTLLYAATVDVLMIRDSRLTVESWLSTRASEQMVGTMFPPTVLPRLADFNAPTLRSIDELREADPKFYVLNADYARAVPADAEPGQLIHALQDGTLGYRLVLRCRTPTPWPWLPAGHPDLVGARLEPKAFSTLRDINPTIDVYERIAKERSNHP
jgi:hypothetical protein